MDKQDNEIAKYRAEIARSEQLRARLESMSARREALAAREEALREAREEESGDVERLEGRSLARYIYSLTGSLEDRLERERMEARAAAVKHDAVRGELEDLDADIEESLEELRALSGCEERYEAAIEARAESLKAAGSPAGERLRMLERELEEVERRLRETDEAIRAGREAESAAMYAEGNLESASDWGTLDLFTDSVIVSLAKHSRVDEAQWQLERLRVAIRRFSTELDDVGQVIDVQTGDFIGFADVFFDGFIFDLAMNSRIDSSLQSVRDTLTRIQGALGRLLRLREECEREHERLSAEYERLVTGA